MRVGRWLLWRFGAAQHHSTARVRWLQLARTAGNPPAAPPDAAAHHREPSPSQTLPVATLTCWQPARRRMHASSHHPPPSPGSCPAPASQRCSARTAGHGESSPDGPIQPHISGTGTHPSLEEVQGFLLLVLGRGFAPPQLLTGAGQLLGDGVELPQQQEIRLLQGVLPRAPVGQRLPRGLGTLGHLLPALLRPLGARRGLGARARG